MRRQIARRYRSQRSEWLVGGGQWPIEIPLGCPSESEAAGDVAATQEWVSAWRTPQIPGEVVWAERRWRRILGTQLVPERVIFRTVIDAAACIEEGLRWRSATARYELIVSRRPSLQSSIPRYFDLLADASDSEIDRIGRVLDWLDSHSGRELYPRQLPIPGIDTKWLESRFGIIADLWGAPLKFRCPSPVARVRILDPNLSCAIGGLSDISAPVDQLAAIGIQPLCIWIVENVQTGLAFGPLPGSVVFMGLGYGVSILSSIQWMRHAECIYWGDIDTHGFSILSRARSVIPHLRSILMDEQTLLLHRDMWVEEPNPCDQSEAPMLTQDEQKVFTALHQNRWATRLRLEQERVAWDYAWDNISHAF
ncbi:MAG TPA: Wadjet anti-phage system protein JetD domain-containing protein [Bryobacteraceae bacterium]